MSKHAFHTALFGLFVPLLGVAQSPPMTVTYAAERDTTIMESAPDTNEGGSQVLFLRSGEADRIVVAFPRYKIKQQLEGMNILKATLEFTVVQNGKDFGKGTAVLGAHQSRRWFAEGNGWNHFPRGDKPAKGYGTGATWNCPYDMIIQNNVTNCLPTAKWWPGYAWKAAYKGKTKPWVIGATSIVGLNNGTKAGGVVKFNVTKDVQVFKSKWRWLTHHGWVVKNGGEPGKGTILFGSRSYQGKEPRLVITYVDPSGKNHAPEVEIDSTHTVTGMGLLTGSGFFFDKNSGQSHTATVDWGEGADPEPLDLNADGSFELSHPYTEPGYHLVTVTITDNQGESGSATLKLKVPQPPASVSISKGAVLTEGQTYKATATVDLNGGEWAKVQINYGDGSSTTVDEIGATATLALEHTYADDGDFKVTAIVYGSAAPSSAEVSAVVKNSAPKVSVGGDIDLKIGETLERVVAISDLGVLDTHIVGHDYGDGTKGEGLQLSHAWAEAGEYVVTVAAKDDDGGLGIAKFTVSVQAPPPTIEVGGPYSLTEGGTLTPQVDVMDYGQPVEVVVDYGQPAGALYPQDGVYTLTATLSWTGGTAVDTAEVHVKNAAPEVSVTGGLETIVGQSLSGSASVTDVGLEDLHKVVVDFGDGTFGNGPDWTHTWNQGGTFNVVVTATDESGATGQGLIQVVVGYPAPTVDAAGPYTIIEGGTLVVEPVVETFTNPDVVIDTFMPGSENGLYAQDGTYTVAVTATWSGGEVIDSAEVIVENAPPVVNAGKDRTLTIGSPMEGVVSFADPGTLDTHTVSVDFGDGQTGTGSAYEHTYSAVGSYAVTATVVDDAGAQGQSSFTVTISPPPPTVSAGGPYALTEGETLTTAHSVVANGNEVDVSVDYGPGNLTGHYPQDGTYTLTVTAKYPGGEVSDTAEVVVANAPPTIELGEDHTMTVGWPMSRSAAVADPGANDVLTVTWDLGDGANAAGETVTHTFTSPGEYVVTATVTDDAGAAASDSFAVTVKDGGPKVVAGDDASTLEGATFSRVANVENVNGVAVLDYGDGSAPGSAEIGEDGSVSFSHVFADNGEYTVTVSAGPASDSFVVSVGNVDPVAEVPEESTAVELQAFTREITIGDPGADTFDVVVVWGDGTEESLTLDAPGPMTITHVFETQGTFAVSITATDDDGGAVEAGFTVQVVGPGPGVGVGGATAEIAEGTTLIRPGQLVGGEPGPFTATVDWGDGSPSEPVALDSKNRYELQHLYADNGLYTVTVTAINSEGTAGTGTVLLTVNNVPPIVDVGENVTADAGVAFERAGTVVDPGADELTATVDYGDGGGKQALAIAADGTVTLSHTWTVEGYFPVAVEVTDDDGGVGKHTVLVGVGVDPLLLDAGEDPTLDEGEPFAFVGTFSDTQMPIVGAIVDYGDGTGEQALSIDADGFTFALSHTYADEGDFDVLITMSDEFGNVGVATLLAAVANVVPVVEVGSDVTQELGDTFSRTASFVDPGDDEWTATVVWGDGSEEETLVVAPDKTIELSHAFETSGSFTVKLTVDDGDEGAHIASLVVDVPNTVPTVTLDAAEVGVQEGLLMELDGAFEDEGEDIWKGTVDWGDGQEPSTLSLGADKSFTLSHVFPDNGTYTVKVTVADTLGEVGEATLIATVTNADPAVNAGMGATLTEGGSIVADGFVVDPGESDTHTGLVDWGDGQTSELTIKKDGTFKLNHTYADNGEYTVSVTVTDDDGGVGVGTTLVSVSNVAPVVDGGPHATIGVGELWIQPGSFVDPGEDTWTVVVDYGDGSGPQTLLATAEKTFELSHTYGVDGIYAVTITVTDDDGGVGIVELNANAGTVVPVVNAGLAAALDEGSTFARSGSFTDVESVSWTATVDWGDGSEIEPLALAADKSFALNHTYADNGSFAVTITVTDDDGGIGTDVVTVNVANVAPDYDLGLPTQTANEGKGYSQVITVSDPGLDTHGATVEWGDGSDPSTIGVSDEEHTFKMSHVFEDNGTYIVQVTVEDDDGGSTLKSIVVNVSNMVPSVSPPSGTVIDEGSVYASENPGSFSDTGTDDWTATVDYGGGSPIESLELSVEKTFDLSHEYVDNGTYTVTVTVSDDDGGIGVGTLQVEVMNVVPLVDLGEDTDSDGAGVFTRTAQVTDPGDDTWTATVNYGDGSGVQPAVVQKNPDDFSQKFIDLSYAYVTNGTYTVEVVVSDDDGGVGSASIAVTVNDVAPAVVIDSVDPVEGEAVLVTGSFTDPGVGPWTGTINFGDGSASEELTLGQDKTFSISHTFPDNGEYVVTGQVTDDLGYIGDGTRTIGVINANPKVILGGAAVFDDGKLNRTGSFEDAGDDIWTAVVDYGDGAGPLPLALNADKTFALSHDYGVPGTFAVSVTVFDEDGGSGTALIEAHNCNPPEGYTKWWMGGAADAPTDWENAANWNPVGVPENSDSVFVCGPVAALPILAQDIQVTDLLVAGGAVLDVGEFAASVSGDLSGEIIGGELGMVVMNAPAAATVQGVLPSLVIKTDATLVGDVRTEGSTTIYAMRRLTLNGHALEVMSDFVVRNNNTEGAHHLVMTQDTDRLLVAGDATFGARNSLTNGTIELKGLFTQTFSSSAFQPAGTLVVFSGEANQEVYFKHLSSYFEDVVVANPLKVTFISNVSVAGGLSLAPSGVIKQELGLKTFFSTKLPYVTEGSYQIATTVVGGDITMAEDLTLPGAANELLVTSGNSLSLNGHALVVEGRFSVANSVSAEPHLIMTHPADKLTVDGLASFGGRTQLTQGTLHFRGDFAQVFNDQAFQPVGTRAVFDGAAPQTVTLTDFGADDSYFRDLAIETAAGVTFASDASVKGVLSVSTAQVSRLVGSKTLTVEGGVNVDGLMVEGLNLTLSGGEWTRFDNVTFQEFEVTDTPLTLEHGQVAAVFSGLVFETTPTTGAYISATDIDGAGSPAVVTVSMASPAYGQPRTTVSGGFVINWGTGTEDTDGDGFSDMMEFALGTSPVDALEAPMSFDAPIQLAVGSDPSDLVVTDIDGDGYADVVSADRGSDSLTVLFQRSVIAGTFEAPVIIALNGAPESVAAGKIDNDSLLDLVAVSQTSNELYVAYQNAGGDFDEALTYPLPGAPRAVTIADVNADGRRDLVVALQGNDQIAICFQAADGSFGAPTLVAVGDAPVDVAVADLNGDGKLDIATVDTFAGTVSVRVQDALDPTTFHAAGTFSVGAQPTGVAIADLTGDGYPDVVASVAGWGTAAVVHQTEAGFQTPTSVTSGGAPSDIAVCDLNDDGTPDLVTSDIAEQTVSLMLATAGAIEVEFFDRVTLSTSATPAAVACVPLDDSQTHPTVLTANSDGTVTLHKP